MSGSVVHAICQYDVMSTKAKVTAYVDPLVHRALKVAAARRNEKESALVERALRAELGIEPADGAPALARLTADEAMKAALDEVRAYRRANPIRR
jgi:hypothetical protein